MEFLCIKCELNLNKRMEDDYVYAPESVLARVISSEVSEKCCNWFRNARAISQPIRSVEPVTCIKLVYLSVPASVTASFSVVIM